jgi:hypothetical protein
MAGIYNFKLDQGSDVNLSLTFYTDTTKTTPINVAANTFTCQIRENLEDEAFIDELTSVGTRINMTDAATGKIVLIFPGSVTKLYSFSKAYYDLYSNLTTVPIREMQGTITLDKEVTK